jgi:hypothetical protein
MTREPAQRLDPAHAALALLLLWGVLAPSVACTSRANDVGDGPGLHPAAAVMLALGTEPR